jgi:hypothetical protein
LFAYQARPRVCFRDDGRVLVFPNKVHIEIAFAPVTGLGGAAPPGLTGIKDQTARLNRDMNTGKVTVSVEKPLDDVTFDGLVGGVSVHLHGTQLELDFSAQSREQLEGVLNVFHHVLPLVLGVSFVDPPTILHTSGQVGDVPFTWQVERGAGSWDVTSAEIQEARVAEAMRRLEVIVTPANRRLLAGVSYFNRAVRLARSGATAFEFTGEVMLNLAKCLEVLFPPRAGSQGRDAARAGLISLGLSRDDIEAYFLPAMALRSQVDVAHVRLTLFSYEQMMTIQDYSEVAEVKFRGMIARLLAAVGDGSYVLQPYEDEGPDKGVAQLLHRLKGSMASAGQASS